MTNVEEANAIAAQTHRKIQQRQENVEDLHQKSEALEEQAQKFKKVSLVGLFLEWQEENFSLFKRED